MQSSSANNAANVGAPGAAPAAPWWRALLDALAAAPRANAAPAGKDAAADAYRDAKPTRRPSGSDAETSAATRDSWLPVTERLDRQREQLAGIDEHLRRIVELQMQRDESTAVYAPPG